MREDFGSLLAALSRAFPTFSLEPVAEAQMVALRQEYPGVPAHYLAFLRRVGYGMLGGTMMLYSGLVEPEEIIGERAASLDGIAFFGDLCGGTMVGFDTRHDWQLVEVEHHTMDISPLEVRTVGEFLVRWLAEGQEAESDTAIHPPGL